MVNIPNFRMRLLDDRQVVVLSIQGRMPREAVSAAVDEFDRVMKLGYLKVVGDLSMTEEVSSEGVGAWLYYRERLEAVGGKVVLVRPPESLMRRLSALGVTDRFPFADSLENALDMMAN